MRDKIYFDKRTFTTAAFIKQITKTMKAIFQNSYKLKNPSITRDFQEKIMLAVTAVNGCIMCSWFHCKMALESGCSDEEISELFNFELSNVRKEEAIALSFAQHYAETNGMPSKQALHRLISYYGTEKSSEILLYIQMITVGNLSGNTIEAFESRLKGIPPKNGDLLLEFVFFLIGAPFYYQIKWKNKKKRNSFNR